MEAVDGFFGLIAFMVLAHHEANASKRAERCPKKVSGLN
jgi:hypothetical protein